MVDETAGRIWGLSSTAGADVQEEHIRQWYVDRFLTFQKTFFQNPSSYFHRYANLNAADAMQTAVQIWESINAMNLRQNILPTRERACN